MSLASATLKVSKPPLRGFRRFFYRNPGPPRMPGAFSLGVSWCRRCPDWTLFTKYAAPNRYTFYIPSFHTPAFRRVVKSGLLRDFHLGGGPAAVTFAVTARCPCSCYHCSATAARPTERWTPMRPGTSSASAST